MRLFVFAGKQGWLGAGRRIRVFSATDNAVNFVPPRQTSPDAGWVAAADRRSAVWDIRMTSRRQRRRIRRRVLGIALIVLGVGVWVGVAAVRMTPDHRYLGIIAGGGLVVAGIARLFTSG